jgi:hypothetical protein
MARGEVHRRGKLPTVHAVPYGPERVVRMGRWVRWLARGRQGGHSCVGHYAVRYCRKLELFNPHRLVRLLCTSTGII